MTAGSGPKLGRLRRVSLRDVWPSESAHFTPWLARTENIDLLGQEIGLELEVEAQEKDVGPFRADILCRVPGSEHWVLIENRLERTDHIHLGQLMTYAAGLDAATIVWIAAQFTEEHRAALDWLNSITGSTINFFGLEIELWRIDEAPPVAPHFNVVSKPNDWSKNVKASAGGSLTPRQQLHLEFWTQFHAALQQRSSALKPYKSSADPWLAIPIGTQNFWLLAYNNSKAGKSGVYLAMDGPHAKARFHRLHQTHRAEVEAQLGSLAWEERPDHHESRVRIERPSKLLDQNTWPELSQWMISTVEKMHSLFAPLVAQVAALDEDSSPGTLEDDLGGSGPVDSDGS